jgi:hypothetical protein
MRQLPAGRRTHPHPHRRIALIGIAALVAGALVLPVVDAAPAAAGDGDTVDQEFSGIGPIGPGATVELDVTGRGGVPATGVGAVALNITATRASAPTFLTAFPTGTARPEASNLNVLPGQTVPNMVISKVGANGTVSIYNRFGSVEVIVDVLGWLPTGDAYSAINPVRVLDTRPGAPTVDGSDAGAGAVGAAGTRDVVIAGRAGIPRNADAVVLNVTVTRPTQPSFLVVWPTDRPRPNAANLNYGVGETVSNLVMVPLGAGGAVSLFNLAGAADVIVDVQGWFGGEGTFTGLSPERLMDTRPGQPTIDGRASGAGRLGAGSDRRLDVVGRGGVPATGVGAVALNVAATEPSANSFLTVWPDGRPRPEASNLNMRPGQTVPNMVLVQPGTDGQVAIFNAAGSTHVVVDVLGWLPSSGGFRGVTPARIMDTRRIGPAPDPNDPSSDPFQCANFTTRIVGNVSNSSLTEISGMARGRRDRSVLWVHEDSGAAPEVHALSLTGSFRQTFRLAGATARDWEDMSIGPGPEPGVPYLYMGDIGDNGRSRDTITIWRVPEPAVTGGGTATIGGAEGIVARYPRGARNAEAMAVGADGTIYVITKDKLDRTGNNTEIYAIPYPQATSGVTTMQQIPAGTLGDVDRFDRSGADIRPDGRALIVRGYKAAAIWPIVPGESMATTLSREPCNANLDRNEDFGEAVAFLGNDGSYITTNEATRGPVRHYTP